MFNNLKLNHHEQHQQQHLPQHHHHHHMGNNNHQLHMHQTHSHPAHPHPNNYNGHLNHHHNQQQQQQHHQMNPHHFGIGAHLPPMLHHPNHLNFDQQRFINPAMENKMHNKNPLLINKKHNFKSNNNTNNMRKCENNSDDEEIENDMDHDAQENLKNNSLRSRSRSQSRSESESGETRSRSHSSNRSFGGAKLNQAESYQPSSKRQKLEPFSPKPSSLLAVTPFQQSGAFHAALQNHQQQQQQLFNAYATALAADQQHKMSHLVPSPSLLAPKPSPLSPLASLPPFIKPKCVKPPKKCDISNIESLIETRGTPTPSITNNSANNPNFLLNNNSVDASSSSSSSSCTNSPFKPASISHLLQQSMQNGEFSQVAGGATSGMPPHLLWYLYALSAQNSTVVANPSDMDRLTVATNSAEAPFKKMNTSSPKIEPDLTADADKSKNLLHSPMSSSSSSSTSSSSLSSSTSLSSKDIKKEAYYEDKAKFEDVAHENMCSEFSEDDDHEKMVDQTETDQIELEDNYEEEEEAEAEAKEELNDTEDEEKKFQSIFDENSYSSEKNEEIETKSSVKEVLNTITTTTKSVSLNDDSTSSLMAPHSNRKKQKLEDSN